MKRVMLMGVLLCATLMAVARDCPRCHGRGKIETRMSVSTYGTDASQMECPHCGQIIMKNESHWDICPVCDGSQQVSSSSDQRSQDRLEAAEDALLEYMTPQELLLMEELMRQIYTQVPNYIPCTICGGTGNCQQCGGYMNISLDGPFCQICGGSGCCISCGGKGYSHIEYIDNPNRDILIQRVNELINGAQNRSQQQEEVYSFDNDGASAVATPGWSIAALLLLCVFGLVGIIVLAVAGFFLYKVLKK